MAFYKRFNLFLSFPANMHPLERRRKESGRVFVQPLFHRRVPGSPVQLRVLSCDWWWRKQKPEKWSRQIRIRRVRSYLYAKKDWYKIFLHSFVTLKVAQTSDSDLPQNNPICRSNCQCSCDNIDCYLFDPNTLSFFLWDQLFTLHSIVMSNHSSI